ncbi:MAG TPA: sensor domain-containing diguanylate cyclase [Pyrinomonadaceae bacterium]|nr:sensor domain-containing diguanylate cyclase [Pyrinomonadaceae bacterium]
MHSLYHSLLAQHSRQLVPVPCAGSTIAQLQRYFEDVVLENNLGALVVESLPASANRPSRDAARLQELDNSAKNLFVWINSEDALSGMLHNRGKGKTKAVVFEQLDAASHSERFVVIADSRFSALLASVKNPDEQDASRDLVVWTFEPDIVYSALEYLMARVTAEHPFHSNSFAEAVRVSMPKATSLQLTLGVTTKLARLLQEQAEREIAVNRVATAIRNTLELDSVLQTAADEVGRALKVHSCAVRVEGALVGNQVTKCYLRANQEDDAEEMLLQHVNKTSERLSESPEPYVVDGDGSREVATLMPYGTVSYDLPAIRTFGDAVVPLIQQGNYVGLLLVRSDDSKRVWAENELLLLHTVADQLAVAVNQAHLFAQMQQQALTDALTGCYNRRSFELQLERDLHLATRMRQPLSLIMVDFDNFKDVNDKAGHEAGDIALRMLADNLRAELRGVDTAARFGGDEFVIILPQATTEGAAIVAERLRSRVEQMVVPGFGRVTSSLGIATFPNHASSRDTLVVAADRALYNSKNAGRNRVSCAEPSFPMDEEPAVQLETSIH